jgi:hypothetical protein
MVSHRLSAQPTTMIAPAQTATISAVTEDLDHTHCRLVPGDGETRAQRRTVSRLETRRWDVLARNYYENRLPDYSLR